jgi:hypothetical protein
MLATMMTLPSLDCNEGVGTAAPCRWWREAVTFPSLAAPRYIKLLAGMLGGPKPRNHSSINKMTDILNARHLV